MKVDHSPCLRALLSTLCSSSCWDFQDAPIHLRLFWVAFRIHGISRWDKVFLKESLGAKDVADSVIVFVFLRHSAELETAYAEVVVVAFRALHAGLRASYRIFASVALS